MRRVSSGLIKERRATPSALNFFQTVVCLYLLIHIKNLFPILRGTEYKLNSVFFSTKRALKIQNSQLFRA